MSRRRSFSVATGLGGGGGGDGDGRRPSFFFLPLLRVERYRHGRGGAFLYSCVVLGKL